MDTISEKIRKVSFNIADRLKTLEAQAKSSVCIFLLGCYCTKHKPFLTTTRDKLIELQIPAMLMEDIEDVEKQPNYAKFQYTCEVMLKSFKMPFPFIYASESNDGCGIGTNTELVTLCENQRYEKLKNNIRLFTEPKAKLPHQEKEVVTQFSIENGEQFVEKALKRSDTEINIMSDILSKDEGK
ncbi:hypothetical protein HYU12_00880 [Candidatus Woesearchaeota archaeon]|nr:hypothetical protein [Candidatus Woesearchaeota archaeon]